MKTLSGIILIAWLLGSQQQEIGTITYEDGYFYTVQDSGRVDTTHVSEVIKEAEQMLEQKSRIEEYERILEKIKDP